jgi:hypothetical protein
MAAPDGSVTLPVITAVTCCPQNGSGIKYKQMQIATAFNDVMIALMFLNCTPMN